jgi:hypothetical protein
VKLRRLAGIPESQVYYVEEGHGSLPNDRTVGRAVQDLLANGSTTALGNDRPPAGRASRMVSEPELKTMASRAIAPGQLGTSDVRHVLDAVAAPDSRDGGSAAGVAPLGAPSTEIAARGAAAPLTQEFKNLMVGPWPW